AFVGGQGGLVLADEASVVVDLPVCPLNDPSAGLEDEPADGLGAADDLQVDPGLGRGLGGHGAGVALVGPDFRDRRGVGGGEQVGPGCWRV
ncbi:MAG: hypothetical protein ACXVGB_04915, partial [Mycobacteriaceae bacterium]